MAEPTTKNMKEDLQKMRMRVDHILSTERRSRSGFADMSARVRALLSHTRAQAHTRSKRSGLIPAEWQGAFGRASQALPRITDDMALDAQTGAAE